MPEAIMTDKKTVIQKCLHLSLIILFLLNFAMTLPARGANEEIVLIANPGVKESAITKKEVRSLFLGMKTKWPDKSKAVFAIHKGGKLHRLFLRKYIAKTESQFSSYWKKQVFTGKGDQPKAFKTEKEVIAYVARTKGAVAYISKAGQKRAKGVKIMKVK